MHLHTTFKENIMKKILLLSGLLLSFIFANAQCWSDISVNTHSVAIKTDGTLWSWGHNSQGQLGDGITVNKLGLSCRRR